MPAVALPLILLAYLLGTVPTAQWVAAQLGHDPTTEGSGNPGATNVARIGGRRAGALVLVGDLGKGLLAAGAGVVVGGHGLGLACAVAVVAGHILPVTRRLQGGKGVATSFGAIIVVWPPVAGVLVAVWALALAVGRRASVASLAAALVCPLAVAAFGYGLGDCVAALGLAVAIVVRHRDNLTRLRRGDEPILRRRPAEAATVQRGGRAQE